MPVHRCSWANGNELLEVYHDEEWGVASLDDQHHFEHLILEIFQAGLNWQIILNKRENFREAFDNFDPEKIAVYSEDKIASLLGNAGIIRNKAKIAATIHNAKTFLEFREKQGSLARYIWTFRTKKDIVYSEIDQIPGTTTESEKLAKELKKIGFKFVGPTTVYAHMQSVGVVNDHLRSCFRYEPIRQMREEVIKQL